MHLQIYRCHMIAKTEIKEVNDTVAYISLFLLYWRVYTSKACSRYGKESIKMIIEYSLNLPVLSCLNLFSRINKEKMFSQYQWNKIIIERNFVFFLLNMFNPVIQSFEVFVQ